MIARLYRAQAVNLTGEGEFVIAEVCGDVPTKRGERYDNFGPYEGALKSIEG
jgi:uncharacterized protein